jgi:alanine racemase
MAGAIRQVVFPEAQVLQRRTVRAGETVGYNATWTATEDTEVAIVNLGYADGYRRAFSDRGGIKSDLLQIIGRISMDLSSVDVSAGPHIGEGDWLPVNYHLPHASKCSGISQYELLTGMGRRYGRCWL